MYVMILRRSTQFLWSFFALGRGGWKSKPGQPQKNKMNLNILRQEQLIAQKKKEIEAKMAEKAKLNAESNSKPPPPSRRYLCFSIDI